MLTYLVFMQYTNLWDIFREHHRVHESYNGTTILRHNIVSGTGPRKTRVSWNYEAQVLTTSSAAQAQVLNQEFEA